LKKLIHISKITLQLIIVIALPMVVFTVITSKFDFLGHIRSYTVVTGSMEPTIKVGSIVFARPQGKYQKGDIITFHRGDISVTHRIFSVDTKTGERYQTKGDANNAADPQLVNSSQVIGKVDVTVPYIGYFASFLKTLPGFSLFIILPSLYIVITELWSIKHEIEKNAERKLLMLIEQTK